VESIIINFNTIIWGVIFLIALVAEALTLALVSIWFSLGAAIALLFSLFSFSNIILEFFVFLIVSVGTLWYFITNKDKFKNLTKEGKTNLDMIVGEEGVVKKEINKHSPGEVYIHGKTWTAIGSNGENIARESVVTIKEISGVKLIVEESKGVE
jgi:membrane protein implicated in regulation of membrane protease activity